MRAHASLIHSQSCSTSGRLIFPVGMNSCSSAAIRCVYCSFSAALKDQFMHTSNSYIIDVSPPGFITWSVFLLFKIFFTSSVVCPQKRSKMSILWRFRRAPGCFCHTWLIQTSTRAWSIQPDSWAWMITPFTFTFGSLSFQDDVRWQFSAICCNAQHSCTPLFFIATSSFCDIFVTFLMHRCVEGHFKVHWSLVSTTNMWNNAGMLPP
jgi:hypothetical protein